LATVVAPLLLLLLLLLLLSSLLLGQDSALGSFYPLVIRAEILCFRHVGRQSF
jgi:hypothetical protein